MIRQRLTFIASIFASIATVLAPPPDVQAASAVGPVAVLSRNSRAGHTENRTQQPSFSQPFSVTYKNGQTRATKWFSTEQSALQFARQNTDAVAVNNQTGEMVYSNMAKPFALMTVALSGQKAASAQDFATLQAAKAAAQGTAPVFIVDLRTGAVVWSAVSNNFLVDAAGNVTPYQSLEAAEAAASAQPTATVVSMANGSTIWKAAYKVLVSGNFMKSFATLADAKAYAEQNPLSQVINVSTGADVWDNIPRYDVYQNGILIKEFAYEKDALAFAKTLQNVTVVEIATQQTVYTNVPNYLVEVGSNVLKSFVDEASAIAYAKTVSGAVVVEISTNQVVWSAAGMYGVYRYLQLVRSFNTLQDAIAFAKTLDHVQVIDTSDNQVVYSNYPNVTHSPNGDVVTVVYGQAVDHSGNFSITIGPAPSFMVPGQTYVTEDYSHWYALTPTGSNYVGQWENPYRTLNLETPSNLTASQINAFIAAHAVASSVLQNTGAYFVEAEKAYGVSAQYLVAHAIIESAWGTSYFAKNRDNLFGYEAYTSNPNAAATFRSIEYDINFEAWFVRNSYLNPNGSFYNGANLDGMNVDYATDPYWANSIALIMAEIAPFTPSMANQPLLGEQATRPVFAYPAGAIGLATKDLTVYASPADATTAAPKAIGSIPGGTKFTVLGDAPGWDQVKLANNQIGFVDWNPVSLQNVLEVTGISYGDYLNVRSSTSTATSANIIDKVTNGSYLVLINNPGNGWDYVTDGNGKTGWVSNQYVKVIH